MRFIRRPELPLGTVQQKRKRHHFSLDISKHLHAEAAGEVTPIGDERVDSEGKVLLDFFRRHPGVQPSGLRVSEEQPGKDLRLRFLRKRQNQHVRGEEPNESPQVLPHLLPLLRLDFRPIGM